MAVMRPFVYSTPALDLSDQRQGLPNNRWSVTGGTRSLDSKFVDISWNDSGRRYLQASLLVNWNETVLEGMPVAEARLAPNVSGVSILPCRDYAVVERIFRGSENPKLQLLHPGDTAMLIVALGVNIDLIELLIHDDVHVISTIQEVCETGNPEATKKLIESDGLPEFSDPFCIVVTTIHGGQPTRPTYRLN